jgi:hypothetical protein
MQGFGGGSPHYYVYKEYGLPTNMMTTRTIDIPETIFESEKTVYISSIWISSQLNFLK